MVYRMRRRAAAVPDLPELAGLERDLFGRDAWSEAALADELAQVPESRYFTVVEASSAGRSPDHSAGHSADHSADHSASRVVGYAILRNTAETAEVQRVGVVAELRRQGIGRGLLAELVDAARQRGCTEMLLEVAASNEAALGLYRSLGFTELSRRPGYYDGGTEDAIVMRRWLTSTRWDGPSGGLEQ